MAHEFYDKPMAAAVVQFMGVIYDSDTAKCKQDNLKPQVQKFSGVKSLKIKRDGQIPYVIDVDDY